MTLHRSCARVAVGAALLFGAGVALAQNAAVVNNKPIPKQRVDEFVTALTAQGRPDTPDLRAAVREELIAREIFTQEAERRGLQPMGAFRGWAVAGCEPDEMGIGPVFAIPKLLKRHGLKIDDIDLWELNEAFASQCLYSRDKLGIDPAKYNVNGGTIANGHTF
jgi:acetyl-CoA acetyltransferase